MAIATVAGLVVLLAACAGRDRHEDVRAGCASASRAFRLAVDRTQTGDMAIDTFRSVYTGYAEIIGLCRQVLIEDAPPTSADLGRLAEWTAATARLTESAANAKGAPK